MSEYDDATHEFSGRLVEEMLHGKPSDELSDEELNAIFADARRYANAHYSADRELNRPYDQGRACQRGYRAGAVAERKRARAALNEQVKLTEAYIDELTDLRTGVTATSDAAAIRSLAVKLAGVLQNMKGAFDTPVERRRRPFDAFQHEAVASLREGLEDARKAGLLSGNEE